MACLGFLCDTADLILPVDSLALDFRHLSFTAGKITPEGSARLSSAPFLCRSRWCNLYIVTT